VKKAAMGIEMQVAYASSREFQFLSAITEAFYRRNLSRRSREAHRQITTRYHKVSITAFFVSNLGAKFLNNRFQTFYIRIKFQKNISLLYSSMQVF
jgi:hypothetical protein